MNLTIGTDIIEQAPHKSCHFTADLLVRGGKTLVSDDGFCLYCADHGVQCQIRHHLPNEKDIRTVFRAPEESVATPRPTDSMQLLRGLSVEIINSLSRDTNSRTLVLKSLRAEFVLYVPADLWSAAERIRDEYKLRAGRDPEQAATEGEFNENELLLSFMEFALGYIQLDGGHFPSAAFLKLLLLTLDAKVLEGNDPHVTMHRKVENISVRDALRTYYDTRVALEELAPAKRDKSISRSALLGSEVAYGRAKVLCIFGGQGNTEDLLEELLELDDVYGALIRPFMKDVTAPLVSAANDSRAKEWMSKGFDVVAWVEQPSSRPPREYLFSAAVSLPLVGLIQLLNYYVTCRVLNISPGQLSQRFVGVTGHSQGIVAAAVVSLSGTEEELATNTAKALQTLFWIGLRAQQAFPETTLSPKILADSVANLEGRPTPMLAIAKLTLPVVQQYVDVSNSYLANDEKIEISLHNGPRAVVCSGPPKSLYGLNLMLRKLKAPPGLNQNRVPFSERKVRFHTKFLPISSPFHCSYLASAVDPVCEDILRLDLAFSGTFSIPVVATDDPRALAMDSNLMRTLVKQICVDKVAWRAAATHIPATHILDFGPGHTAGIGSITHRIVDGSGVQVVLAGTIESNSPSLLCKRHLFQSAAGSVAYGVNWGRMFAPALLRSEADGIVYVDTKFSRLLGKQPLMVAGMTPSTADAGFVAACINANYHVELAGGGHYHEKALRDKIDVIMSKVSAGQGISVNVLFINQKQWGFQFPLVQVLRSEGIPIEGFTCAAGIPSMELAGEIITALRSSGIRHISFKPGSVEGILQVVSIAKNHPSCPIILQWTGGRAGGHHSYEDFHQPILDTYSSIRSQSNIILVGGSGFGDGDETFPYLDGSWSTKFDHPAMPFDGILLGSRVMVAAEGAASRSVKEMIVAASGIEDESQWVQSYRAPVGGVVTVISELGEPIHKIATRGVMLWKELDETVFKLPKDKRVEYLRVHRDRTIKRLNEDFQKVWFGQKVDGRPVDLFEMTYDEVLRRMAELMYVRHQGRWIDKSYRKLFFDFVARFEERLTTTSGSISCVPSDAALHSNPNINPLLFLDMMDEKFPHLNRYQLMTTGDCMRFVNMCRRPGQKPVPFIPILDEDFENWFKKDSLWQSEDIDAVVGQDAGRVCILQGPVAVRHSKRVDEPVKDILDGIVERHVELITQKLYDGDRDAIPTIPWFGLTSISLKTFNASPNVRVRSASQDGSTTVLTVGSDEQSLPDEHAWRSLLVSGRHDWFACLIFSEHILQDKRIVPNAVMKLFAARPGWSIHLDTSSVTVKDNLGRVAVLATYLAGKITVNVFVHKANSSSKLELLFNFDPRNATYPIAEVTADRNTRIKRFFWGIWFPDQSEQGFAEVLGMDPLKTVFTCSAVAEPEAMAKFCRIIGNNHSVYAETANAAKAAPMDFAIVVAWESVIKSIFPAAVDGDLLRLVHLSNAFSFIHATDQPIMAGDTITTEAQVTSIRWTPTGKIVEVEAICKRAGIAILKVASRFMYRGSFSKVGLYFERCRKLSKSMVIKSPEDSAVLLSKPWLKLNEGANVDIGSRLLFKIDYFHQEDVKQSVLTTIECHGDVLLKTDTKEYSLIGHVDFKSDSSMRENPVLNYLDRQSYPLEEPTVFPGDGIPVTAEDLDLPTNSSNQNYSDVSGDHNPIHTSPLLADLAGLPGTITHGMWTSAGVRGLVETYAAENQPLRVRSYDVSFEGMVLPNDKLTIRLNHVGMHLGRKMVRIEASNQHGSVVLKGTAEVDQSRTAFVFTGQGSQEVGMGMDLYASSAVARSVWDTADAHFFSKYGFSIIQIVRANPKSLTVYFGGPVGQEIKANYQSMVYERVNEDGTITSTCLLPSIGEDTSSYTFNSPNGLLYATQFTQPALTLMEMAAYEDMKYRGVAGPGSVFCGHSLGEYAALASVGDVLSIETMCDIVFYRGLTMQVAVPRDDGGRSEYGMVAVNPGRVSNAFDDKLLRGLVPLIARLTGCLLEIVNYNVENYQYVVAGELVALETLTQVLNALAKMKIDFGKFSSSADTLIMKCFESAKKKKEEGALAEVERGFATIPLVGIDVPFHSSFLLGGVPSFRKCLELKIKTKVVDAAILRGKYIPNLTAVPFDTTLAYVHTVCSFCNSPALKEIAANWSDEKYVTAAAVQVLARTILIELLAFQFASPVRWIETQDVIFRNYSTERLIEIGPTPVLIGMAERTLKIKYQTYDDALNQERTLWTYSKHRAEINYEQAWSQSVLPAAAVPTPAPSPAPVAAPTVSVAAAPSGRPAERIEELPYEASEFLRMIVALKAKKTMEEVPGSKSIKEISGGKSTLQNEIIADLQKEFGDSLPERGEELPLDELAAALRPSFTKVAGKYSSGLVNRLFSSKMPPGFTIASVRESLSNEFGLGTKAADSLMLYSLSHEPKTRLSGDDAAKSWIREVAAHFFQSHSMSVAAVSAGSAVGGGGATISSAELEQMQAKHKRLIKQQIDLFASYVEHNLLEFRQVADTKAVEVAALQKDLDLFLAEHGQSYLDGVVPMFSAVKTRRYDSYWNWARQDVWLLYNDILFGRLVMVDRNITAKCLHVMNRAFPELVVFMENLVAQLPRLMYTAGLLENSVKLTEQFSNQLIEQVRNSLTRVPKYKDVSFHTRPAVQISNHGDIEYSEVRRMGVNHFAAYVKEMRAGSSLVAQRWRSGRLLPHLFLRERSPEDHAVWAYSEAKSGRYLDVLTSVGTDGVSFSGRTALMTGCGRGSIGVEVLKGLLSGGARVVVTTSSFTRTTVDYFRSVYERHGARGSCLIVAPFNQGSVQDVDALVAHIYEGLDWDLDFVLPFGAVPENGRELTDLDGRSELAHRIMLTNVLRLLGAIAKTKKQRRIETRPALVVLPLSPNHGVFGGDGLYGESKIGLETLLNRWHSESWRPYLSISGAVIGWTRGTGLMNENNMIAEAMEAAGIRTFSSNEMAFNLLGLMHYSMVRMAETSPVYADLNGGLDAVSDLAEFTQDIRRNLTSSASIKRAMFKEAAIEASLTLQPAQESATVVRKANLQFDYPKLPPHNVLPGNHLLADLLDLEQVVVVTGFAEVGPWGNSRTRWEMEANGEFSLEGCVEMAWLMGLIKFVNTPKHTGWADAASGEPVPDSEVKSRYEATILAHSGIRFIEPELFGGYDPNKKSLSQEVVIDYDMAPIEVSKEEAEQFKLQHKEKADVYEKGDGGWVVRLRRGATIIIPKALRFDRLVAGQMPTGWNAARYGVPQEIIAQVDPLTLFVLVSTVEALVSAGVTDPYEFYQYVHVAEVGNTSGSGEGGMVSSRSIFKNRYLDKPVANDVLQESFINTMAAWVNLLLLSSSGPIKTPVGACATAVESVEIGVDTILSGKAKVVVVGGFDDFQEESSYEFAAMKATSSAVDEAAKGRQPDEMSRPAATSRAGFMESQGAGIQLLMTAKLALEMGCPVYGIVALTNTATDKEGRSIPAPGQGILTTARSVRPPVPPRILDMSYRHRRLMDGLKQVQQWFQTEVADLEDEAAAIGNASDKAQFVVARTKDIERERERQEQTLKRHWGTEFWRQDHRIASIEGALATFGLTIDDIGVASFHGTGTKANDLNESEVVNRQLTHLGRKTGNILPCVFQKYLTGHPKGAAAAWMMNGVMQIMSTGVIPGNRNADNIDEKLESFGHLLYLSRTLHTTGIRAALLKSFGFGQVGGEILMVHPDYLYAALSPAQYAAYATKRSVRQNRTYRFMQDGMTGRDSLVKVKTEPPYPASLESAVYLNPAARASYDPRSQSWAFTASGVESSSKTALQDNSPASLLTAMQTMVGATAANKDHRTVGVDVQLVTDLCIDDSAFVERNYTQPEVEYCTLQPDPRASFAGRWAAKEAVFKALSQAGLVSSSGAAGSLKDIEILPGADGVPTVRVSSLSSVPTVNVSISHSGTYAVAVAML